MNTWWFASRASGMVLWLILAASVGWGLAVSGRVLRRKGLPAWMLDLHKHLGTLAAWFTALHLYSLWADSYVTFGWRELFIPMASGWKPGAVAWGIVAFYLLVIVQGSSLIMKRLPRRLWHRVHLLSLPLFVTGSAHGILAGSDWGNTAVRSTAIVVATSLVWIATMRIAKPTKADRNGAGDDRIAAARAARDARNAAKVEAASTGSFAPPVPGTDQQGPPIGAQTPAESVGSLGS
jgi:methionine sulfoxide reductase heme-binding subunit